MTHVSSLKSSYTSHHIKFCADRKDSHIYAVFTFFSLVYSSSKLCLSESKTPTDGFAIELVLFFYQYQP